MGNVENWKTGLSIVLAALGFFMQIESWWIKDNESLKQGQTIRGMILVLMALILLCGK